MLGAVHAFLWTSSTGMKDLGELHFGSEAFAINNLGWVVGGSHNSSGQGRAFLWTPSAAGAVSGAMRDLGILPGGDYSVASGVNDAGQIVGMSTTAQGSAHAVLWAISATGDVSIQDLGELPGATHAAALAINDLGQVVGRGDWVGDQSYAFFWTAQDGMIELSPSAAGCSSDLCAEALALNNLGTVVGAAWAGSGAHATRWTVRVIPPTPVEQIQTIETQVQALLSSGVVNGGQGNALIAKLDAATAQINKGNTKAAVNVLQAFINQCLALVNAGTLTAQQAQPLIDAATALIQRLSSTP